ncbi:MAG TPA: BatD family protein [Chthoniobacterales bacterium]|nr:BatD family protein [Chthoniobacterales bacterium]
MARSVSILCFLSLCALHSALADSPSVTAVLSNSEAVVGEVVHLDIQVTGAANPKPPADIKVDGLDIRRGGVSRQVQMNNFNVSYTLSYNFMILPLREGTFKIPPQDVDVGGKTLRTPELVLNVGGSSSSTARPRSGRQRQDTGTVDPAQIGFLEMLLPKAVAYVGEVVPVQLRLGLLMRAPVDSLGSGIQIAGQGFTTQKITEPRQTVETINGRSYQVFIFKTAISAARTGTLEIGPAEITPIVRVARSGQRNPSLPRDLFDDPFFNNFFNDPAFAPSVPREVPLKSERVTLEVKPLPPNAPPTFTGAVGSFTMRADANPKKAQAGDPITITATITGRGNFDRVSAPALEEERGWHKYPPNDNFKQDDDVGISGTKTFEMVLSAKERKNQIPPLTFSFFDPVKETYVTLRSDAIPVSIEGGAPAAATTPPATAAPAASVPPSPAATPARAEQDILYQLTEAPRATQSFAPLYQRRAFWLAQLLPALALAAFIAWKIRRGRADNREAQRLARLQHEAAEVQRRLHRHDLAAPEYVASASRAVQLKTAMARNIDPNVVDAEEAAATFQLDEERRRQLERLFAESDELRYSGNGQNGHPITPEQRREILELVENLRA